MGAEVNDALANPQAWILHERARTYFWQGSGHTSIKTFFHGSAQYKVGSACYAADERSYLVLNSGQNYSIEIAAPEPVESFCLFFPPPLVADLQRVCSEAAEKLLDDPAPSQQAQIHFFEKTYAHDELLSPALLQLRRKHRQLSPERRHEELHRILERLLKVHLKTRRQAECLPALRASTREELYRRVWRARDYAEAMYAERVSLSDLARAACLSPNHLLRTFREAFGQTPHQFLTQCRLDRAKQLLEATDLPVTEICFSVGFESLGSFGTLFRRCHGRTPAECRKKVTSH